MIITSTNFHFANSLLRIIESEPRSEIYVPNCLLVVLFIYLLHRFH
jgi:hypothetical protein